PRRQTSNSLGGQRNNPPNPPLHVTGAAILASRDIKFFQRPARQLIRSVRPRAPAAVEVNMSRNRLAVLGVTVALLIGWGSSTHPTDGGEAEFLQGSWEVTSVQRDGEPDPLQVGAQMTFTSNEVKFQPKAVQFVDGTS